jgi:hypothetical protein
VCGYGHEGGGVLILSDVTLRAELAAGGLVIDPQPADAAIQPASIDLHLGDNLRWDPELDRQAAFMVDGDDWDLWPDEFALGHTAETVTIPPHLVAQLNGKSRVHRPRVHRADHVGAAQLFKADDHAAAWDADRAVGADAADRTR